MYETENVPHVIGNKHCPPKIDQFNISEHLKTPPSRQDLICSNPTGNSHGPLGVQFRKKRMKLKMFLMLLAISVAHRKIDHFNISNLLKAPL
jgi:hypothetical protein